MTLNIISCTYLPTVSSLVKNLFKSSTYLLKVLFLLILLNFESFTWYGYIPLSDILFANILTLFGFSFHSLNSVFQRVDIFNYNRVSLINLFFHWLHTHLVSELNNLCLISNRWARLLPRPLVYGVGFHRSYKGTFLPIDEYQIVVLEGGGIQWGMSIWPSCWLR